MLKQMDKKPLPIAIMSATLVCLVTFSIFAIKFSSLIFILIAGILGIVFFYSNKHGRGMSK